MQSENATERLLKSLLKLYFLLRKKWTVKQNFEELINFIDFELEDLDLSAHILFASKNITYCMANSVAQFLKLNGDFLHD